MTTIEAKEGKMQGELTSTPAKKVSLSHTTSCLPTWEPSLPRTPYDIRMTNY